METHVFSVPEVMSSVTRMMHLWPFTVDFQESWKRTMFGCCSPFSISTSSLKRCRSALVSLRVCREKSNSCRCVYMHRSSIWFQVRIIQLHTSYCFLSLLFFVVASNFWLENRNMAPTFLILIKALFFLELGETAANKHDTRLIRNTLKNQRFAEKF